VARALAGRSARPYVFTKCELVWDDKREIRRCLKADSIRRECENSLKRLKVETIDLYQAHWPEPDEDIEEGWDAGQAEGRRQSAVDRGLQFQRGADGAVPEDCAGDVAATAVFGDFAGGGRSDSAVCAQHGMGAIVYSR